MRRRPLNVVGPWGACIKATIPQLPQHRYWTTRSLVTDFKKPGPFKQGCVASLLKGTSLKKSKAHATVCEKPLISTSG